MELSTVILKIHRFAFKTHKAATSVTHAKELNKPVKVLNMSATTPVALMLSLFKMTP